MAGIEVSAVALGSFSMENLALAASVVQSIDLYHSIISYINDSKNIHGEAVKSLDNVGQILSTTLSEFPTSESHVPSQAIDPQLWLLSQDCYKLGKELSELLAKGDGQSRNSMNPVRRKIAWNRYNKDLERLLLSTNYIRDRVEAVLLLSIREQSTKIDHGLRMIEESTNDLQTLRLEQDSLLVANQVDRARRNQSSGVVETQDLLAAAVAQLNLDDDIRAVVTVKDYKVVTVQPVMWDEPRPSYLDFDRLQKHRKELVEMEGDLTGLGDVFRDRFHYDVKDIWRIPDDRRRAQRDLKTKMRRLVDDHAQEGSLLIILYAGHGADTRSMEWKAGTDESIWASINHPSGAQVNWSVIQPELESSDGDTLLILDCCFSGTAITRGGARTVTEVLAAATSENVAYGGTRAYSRVLKRQLETANLPCSVQRLHDDMLSDYNLNKPVVSNEDGLQARPDHGWAGNSLERTIALKPLPVQTTNVASTSELETETTATRDPTRPRLFIELEFEHPEDMDTVGVVKLKRWLTAQQLPTSVQDWRFYTAAEMHAQMMHGGSSG